MLYLVCLSGTLAVFYPEFERWEQPGVRESTRFDPAAVERAYHAATTDGATHYMFIALPTPDSPRISLSNEKSGWFVNEDGSLGPVVKRDWTHLLVDLHLYLHLPANVGMILVSALGAVVCGLIVSGLMAHPRIFKDAFALRWGGSRLLEQADLHNRLSVWSSPFQLMIAVTGAYFGLAQLMSMLMAPVYFDGDRAALTARVFGTTPQLQQPAQPLAVASALNQMKTIAPNATPIYVTVEEADVPEKRYMIIGATLPQRLIYAEQYHFDSAGRYLGKVGFSDGEPGRQVIFSVYRLHFGYFGGFAVKMLYGVLGLAMTVVCVTGFNVWLARRKRRDYLANLWAGFVWGTVPGLALAAIAQIVFGVHGVAVFWITVLAAMALSQVWNDETRAKQRLEIAGAAAITALVVGHCIRFGAAAFDGVAPWVNGSLLLAALILLGAGLRRAANAASRNAATSRLAGGSIDSV